MNRLNVLLTLSTITIVLVILERVSPTTQIILQPYNFLRLHEVIQMCIIILATVLIPFFILKELTHNFEDLQNKRGLIWGGIYITGVYFYATGNGAHEIASYLFNTFCDTKTIENTTCGSMFFNDYYFGNILYFVGAYLMNIPLILFEIRKKSFTFDRKNMIILICNAVLYSFAIIAYAAFDLVAVGLVFTLIFMASVIFLFFNAKRKVSTLPFTLYSLISYVLGGVISTIIRLF